MFNIKECKLSFNECIKTLIERIKSYGAEVFAIVDHSENARKVGLNLEPTVVVYFGNPRVGTLLMLENRHIAYELPLRFLVWSENGVVKIGYRKPSDIGEEYNIRHGELLEKMDKFMEGLLSNL
ncbi:MAG: DUF302 domain-containing protein [Saccharolobus sp.]|uniref:DUF302 domain-containing protein n=2 Tax=Saccharolobus shibatae TaxID=2286 RepID=A0A8F5BWN1_9CREN|nr:DUF302 domain-containing protein [Saccharolobus shibatae]MCH4815123.1 DUF302 domain-containing protein [Saccharolobus shibatae]QXJ29611.1 Uncharacterized protein J5U23_02484 [Saccharolobus shibatae B12]QXJ32841.1 Uncharacterized protein J5U21_02496 [Saccharolobus shibatae]QXJ35971.1 Uncharacterized protein J5U22_02522 [Saccharolobus shibatae]